MKEFLKHIKDQLELTLFEIEIDENYFYLMNDNIVYYKEKIFQTYDRFTKDDIADMVLFVADDSHKFSANFNYFRNWYLITHEKYFIKNIIYDRYDRISSSNLMDDFKVILKYPISDVIKQRIQEKLNIKYSRKVTVYNTCDFDSLNIWDQWKFKDLCRELFYGTIKLQFRKNIEILLSYLFSRFSGKFNYYLNDKMFTFNDDEINLGFLITSPKSGYDGKFSYKNKVVKKFIESLIVKGVQLGLHTSYYTHDGEVSIMEQREKFNELIGFSPKINRHHYLRFKFPEYLSTLEKIGIQKDYSLYFADCLLFRCGTSSSFVPWNENDNCPFSIQLNTITLMDGTFSDYLKCSLDDAFLAAKQKLNLCFKYSTDVVLLWHNNSMYRYCPRLNNYHYRLLPDIKMFIRQKLER